MGIGNSRGQPLGVWGPTQTPTCTPLAPVHPRVWVIPMGVGVLTLRGFTPGWGTYPLIHAVHRKKYNITIYYLQYANYIHTGVVCIPPLPPSSSCCCHCRRHCLAMALSTSSSCWHGHAGTIVTVVFVVQGQEWG